MTTNKKWRTDSTTPSQLTRIVIHDVCRVALNDMFIVGFVNQSSFLFLTETIKIWKRLHNFDWSHGECEWSSKCRHFDHGASLDPYLLNSVSPMPMEIANRMEWNVLSFNRPLHSEQTCNKFIKMKERDTRTQNCQTMQSTVYANRLMRWMACAYYPIDDVNTLEYVVQEASMPLPPLTVGKCCFLSSTFDQHGIVCYKNILRFRPKDVMHGYELCA